MPAPSSQPSRLTLKDRFLPDGTQYAAFCEDAKTLGWRELARKYDLTLSSVYRACDYAGVKPYRRPPKYARFMPGGCDHDALVQLAVAERRDVREIAFRFSVRNPEQMRTAIRAAGLSLGKAKAKVNRVFLLQAISDGKTTQELCQLFGVTFASLRYHARCIGYSLHNDSQLKPYHAQERIAS